MGQDYASVGHDDKVVQLENIISKHVGLDVFITLESSRWYAYNPDIGIKEVSELLKEFRNGRSINQNL